MYFFSGAQLCNYGGSGCEYEGEEGIMQLGSEMGIVSCCTLNNIERIMDEMFLEEFLEKLKEQR